MLVGWSGHGARTYCVLGVGAQGSGRGRGWETPRHYCLTEEGVSAAVCGWPEPSGLIGSGWGALPRGPQLNIGHPLHSALSFFCAIFFFPTAEMLYLHPLTEPQCRGLPGGGNETHFGSRMGAWGWAGFAGCCPGAWCLALAGHVVCLARRTLAGPNLSLTPGWAGAHLWLFPCPNP